MSDKELKVINKNNRDIFCLNDTTNNDINNIIADGNENEINIRKNIGIVGSLQVTNGIYTGYYKHCIINKFGKILLTSLEQSSANYGSILTFNGENWTSKYLTSFYDIKLNYEGYDENNIGYIQLNKNSSIKLHTILPPNILKNFIKIHINYINNNLNEGDIYIKTISEYNNEINEIKIDDYIEDKYGCLTVINIPISMEINKKLSNKLIKLEFIRDNLKDNFGDKLYINNIRVEYIINTII